MTDILTGFFDNIAGAGNGHDFIFLFFSVFVFFGLVYLLIDPIT